MHATPWTGAGDVRGAHSEYSSVTSLRGNLSLSQPRATTPLETALPRHLESTRANQESSACGKRLTRSWRSRRPSSPRTSFRTPPCGRPPPSRSFTIVLRSCRTSLAIVRALAPPASGGSSRGRGASVRGGKGWLFSAHRLRARELVQLHAGPSARSFVRGRSTPWSHLRGTARAVVPFDGAGHRGREPLAHGSHRGAGAAAAGRGARGGG